MISKNDFIRLAGSVKGTIPSITGKAAYTGFKVENETLYFHRVIPKTDWKLDLNVLYQVYVNNSFINTTIIKSETGGRVNSPSVALLLAMGFIDKKGNRII